MGYVDVERLIKEVGRSVESSISSVEKLKTARVCVICVTVISSLFIISVTIENLLN